MGAQAVPSHASTEDGGETSAHRNVPPTTRREPQTVIRLRFPVSEPASGCH